jgi:hypothetical protein
MAHVWLLDGDPQGAAAPKWSPRPLDGDSLAVPPARLLRADGDGTGWVIVGPAAVAVNGSRLDTGIRVLRDRDELRAAAGRVFFSTESLAVVVPFPDTGRKTFCPRCKLEIAPGSPAVRCPACGVWHHQSEEFPCWTYAPRCALCDHPSALDAGYRWVPEDL